MEWSSHDDSATTPGVPAAQEAHQQSQERRKSSEDGQFYTLREFIEFCGEEDGRYWWDRAAPIAEASSSSVVPAATLQTGPRAAELRPSAQTMLVSVLVPS